MKVNELMNKNIISINKEALISDLSHKMKEYNIGFIPVVDNNKVIGVITDRDIVVNAVANNCDINCSIDSYINNDIVSIECDKDINDALDLMSSKKVKRLIVTDKKKVVGIISLSDILKTDLDKKIMETIRTIWDVNDHKKEPDSEIDEFYL